VEHFGVLGLAVGGPLGDALDSPNLEIMLWLLVSLMKMFMMALLFAIVAVWTMSTMLVSLRTRLLGMRMVIHMVGAGRRS
jgi:hypothetical protein